MQIYAREFDITQTTTTIFIIYTFSYNKHYIF